MFSSLGSCKFWFPTICKPFIRDLSIYYLDAKDFMMENTEDFLNKLVFQNNNKKNPTGETKKASEFIR